MTCFGLKNKERVQKAAREEGLVTCEGRPIRVIENYTTERFTHWEAWKDIVHTQKYNCVQLYIVIEGEINISIVRKDCELSKMTGINAHFKSNYGW